MVSVQFLKNFTGHFLVGGTKNFKLLAHISFSEQLSKYYVNELTATFMCLLLSWSRQYSMKWSSTSTTRKFNNSLPLFLNFSNMINLCSNNWFIKNLKCQQFLFWKGSCHKNNFFIFLKDLFFIMGGPIDINVDVFWETSVGFLKSVVLQLFSKDSQSYVNWNVKGRTKFNCL